MALVQSVSEISHLFPKAHDLFYMGTITHTDKKASAKNPINVFEVDGKTKKIIASYRVEFSLLSTGNNYFLFIRRENDDLRASSIYIKAKANLTEKPKETDWPFTKDEIGLHANVGVLNNKILYFGTSFLDAKEIKEKLKKREEKSIVVTETVYV